MMKKLDVLIVRLLPFVLFIIYGMNVYLACMNKPPFISYELHGNSALYAIGLFLISLANKRYHCIWNRAMYIFLIIVPIFNYIDSIFNIVPVVETYLLVIHTLYGLTAFVTAYLAIRHFISISKRKL